MIGLTILEVCSSIFIFNTTNNNFELYTDTFDEFSFTQLKDEPEEIPNSSDNTPYHLQHEKTGPRSFEGNRNLRLEKSSTDAYIVLILSYARSPFREFESYLRIVVDSNEGDIQLMLKQYNSNFVTYELQLGIYSVEDVSEAVNTRSDHEGTLQIEYEDVTMETKLILTRFGSTFWNVKV